MALWFYGKSESKIIPFLSDAGRWPEPKPDARQLFSPYMANRLLHFCELRPLVSIEANGH
jgi:hypothetical protein